jgi:molybdate transport system substrate-binding protein
MPVRYRVVTRRRRLLSGWWCLLVCWFCPGQVAADAPVVAVAANLRFAVTEIADAYERQGNDPVRLSFGSSGNIRRQISQGAPFEIFVSADDANALALHEQGLAEDEGVVLATGQLALYAADRSPIVPDTGLAGLEGALEQGLVRRFAIANPEHAPFGQVAREVLVAQDLWDEIQPFLVVGENAGQAAQFAASGSVDGALIPYSLVVASGFGGSGRHAVVASRLHAPLHQRMVLLSGAGEKAREFFAYLQSPQASVVMERHGFLPPHLD